MERMRWAMQCVLQDPEVPELLWCGTEQGLWWSHDGGFAWQCWKEGVRCSGPDIVLQERESTWCSAPLAAASTSWMALR